MLVQPLPRWLDRVKLKNQRRGGVCPRVDTPRSCSLLSGFFFLLPCQPASYRMVRVVTDYKHRHLRACHLSSTRLCRRLLPRGRKLRAMLSRVATARAKTRQKDFRRLPAELSGEKWLQVSSTKPTPLREETRARNNEGNADGRDGNDCF